MKGTTLLACGQLLFNLAIVAMCVRIIQLLCRLMVELIHEHDDHD